MTNRGLLPRILAAGLIVSVQSLCIPVSAETANASLTGTIVSATDHTPLSGAKLHVADPKTGEIFSSSPTRDDGSFSVKGLPAAGYELAVETDGGLFLVRTPVQLAPGKAQNLTVAINRKGGKDGPGGDPSPGSRTTSLWDNPGTAAGLVIGLAFLVGVVIEDATDDDDKIIRSDPTPGG